MYTVEFYYATQFNLDNSGNLNFKYIPVLGLVLALVMFLVTTFLLANMAAVGQAPLAMYLFFGGIGYCVSITVATMASFVEQGME